ncbi:MAG: phosphoribosylpyrophosphate synthetase [Bacteroidetes bacterium]|nr:phosphoribosylpyrophosphate synthetase [Bacteroidota bacterium]
MEPTLVDILDRLKREGYTEDLNLRTNCLECTAHAVKMYHDEFKIDSVIRLEGASDPADEVIVYAISSEKHGIKGVLVNAYGMYSEPLADELAAALSL